ncbi:sensor histidine kinase [Oceanobacillus sp. CAU 1775]
MSSYWLWLLLNIIIWPFAILFYEQPLSDMIFPLLGVFLYLINFFIIPLIERKPRYLVIVLSVNIILATAILFPYENGSFNPYLILILSVLIAEGFYRLDFLSSIFIGLHGAAGLIIASLFSDHTLFLKTFIGVYLLLLLFAMLLYKKTRDYSVDLDERYQALLMEYREIKRRTASEEEVIRQEERVFIAQEIHDSVGHKLTALLMQLEMFRLHTPEAYKKQVGDLKQLASDSLEETRRAVKSLKETEVGGLTGILQLIRKLEMEQFIRIHFSVKHGAFSAPLSGEQSFVIYRAVQEALTNIMKHSQAREAEVMFEAPGGSIFRFEINNPIAKHHMYQEGFGITSMRKRVEKFGGELNVYQTEERFVVQGYIKLDRGA